MRYREMQASDVFENEDQILSKLMLVITSPRTQLDLHAVVNKRGKEAYASLSGDVREYHSTIWEDSEDVLRRGMKASGDMIDGPYQPLA